MEYAPTLKKIPKSECPDIWIRLPRHKWPKSWSSMEDPVVPLERNLYGHPLSGLLCERQFEKVLLKYGWEKVPSWECLFVYREKGLFLSVYVDDIKLAGKKQKYQSDVESTKQRSWFGRTNIFPWSSIPGLYPKDNVKWAKILLTITEPFWIQNFRRNNWKITMLGKSAYFFVVLWHGRPCQEMCGTILWVGEQDDSTTLQSINSMHWWPPLQRRRNEICWRIVTSMLPNCSEMLILGTYWTTWHSMVSQQACEISHKMDSGRLGLFQTLLAILRTRNQPQVVSCVFFWTVHPQTKHVQSCTAQSHFITRTHVAQELQSSGLHIFVSLEQLSSACHVSFLAAPDTDHKHMFLSHPFHPLLLSFRHSHVHKQDLWFSTPIYLAMVHGRVADQDKSHLSQVMRPRRLSSKRSRPKRSNLKTSIPEELSLEGILGQIRIKYRKD